MAGELGAAIITGIFGILASVIGARITANATLRAANRSSIQDDESLTSVEEDTVDNDTFIIDSDRSNVHEYLTLVKKNIANSKVDIVDNDRSSHLHSNERTRAILNYIKGEGCFPMLLRAIAFSILMFVSLFIFLFIALIMQNVLIR